jgi:hypothetical protein
MTWKYRIQLTARQKKTLARQTKPNREPHQKVTNIFRIPTKPLCIHIPIHKRSAEVRRYNIHPVDATRALSIRVNLGFAGRLSNRYDGTGSEEWIKHRISRTMRGDWASKKFKKSFLSDDARRIRRETRIGEVTSRPKMNTLCHKGLLLE